MVSSFQKARFPALIGKKTFATTANSLYVGFPDFIPQSDRAGIRHTGDEVTEQRRVAWQPLAVSDYSKVPVKSDYR